MKNAAESEIKVGIFVTFGVILMMISILLLGGFDKIFVKQNTFVTRFKAVDGLVIGAKVVVAGLSVGAVTAVDFEEKDSTIRITVTIPDKMSFWIRKDSEAEILTQGVLGDKYLSIVPGTANAEPLASGSEIIARPTKDFTQVLTKSDNLIVSLNSIAVSLDRILRNFDQESHQGQLFKNVSTTARNLSTASAKLNDELANLQLQKASKSLNSILDKINNGTGTVGALINDPSLYEDAKSLMGGVNRNRLMRNLVRQTVKDADQEK
jgi:phospholipid/cholesterol/gamma-HCH transport system substrate-binding protein